MRFPDALTLRRRTAADEYGNPGQGLLGPPEPLQGFLATPERLLLPPRAVLAPGDEVTLGSRRFAVAEVNAARSPSKTVLVVATVKEIPT